jgi:hypothetical protein
MTGDPAGAPSASAPRDAGASAELCVLLACFTGRDRAAKIRRQLDKRLAQNGDAILDQVVVTINAKHKAGSRPHCGRPPSNRTVLSRRSACWSTRCRAWSRHDRVIPSSAAALSAAMPSNYSRSPKDFVHPARAGTRHRTVA